MIMMRFAVMAAVLLAGLTSLPLRAETAPALIDARALGERLGDDGLVVLDIQSSKDYQRFHVPGAVNAPYDQWRTRARKDGTGPLPSMLPPVDRLEAMIGGLGIGNDDQVIIVATGRGAGDLAAAARVFWTFKVLGHDAVSVLEGGLAAYAEAGGRLAQGTESRPPAQFVASPRPELAPDADAVRAAVGSGVLPVDGRSEGEFVGLYTGDDKERPGTIPGARNLPYDWVTDDGSARLRSAGALRELFAARGVDPDRPQVHFCHSGNRAALSWFAAYAVLGNEQAVLYDGSMMEWARRDDLPVEAAIRLCKAC
jgi:thiosulfate/3-mercaptopyruvate sulfurtransferase